jgi:hypothetical protein
MFGTEIRVTPGATILSGGLPKLSSRLAKLTRWNARAEEMTSANANRRGASANGGLLSGVLVWRVKDAAAPLDQPLAGNAHPQCFANERPLIMVIIVKRIRERGHLAQGGAQRQLPDNHEVGFEVITFDHANDPGQRNGMRKNAPPKKALGKLFRRAVVTPTINLLKRFASVGSIDLRGAHAAKIRSAYGSETRSGQPLLLSSLSTLADSCQSPGRM